MNSRRRSPCWHRRPHPNHEVGISDDDPITSSITDRFCGGQSDSELGRHLSLYPSRALNDLICACIRWESSKSQIPYKPVETMFAVKTEDNSDSGPTMDELEEIDCVRMQ